MNLLSLLLILLGIILGVVGGYVVARNLLLQKQSQARQTAEDIVNQAHKEADNIKKEKLLVCFVRCIINIELKFWGEVL